MPEHSVVDGTVELFRCHWNGDCVSVVADFHFVWDGFLGLSADSFFLVCHYLAAGWPVWGPLTLTRYLPRCDKYQPAIVVGSGDAGASAVFMADCVAGSV